jgi:hypothetical protein
MTASPAALVLYTLTAADAKAVTDAAGAGAATAGTVLPAIVIRSAKKGAADLQVFYGSGSVLVSGAAEGDGEGTWRDASLAAALEAAIASAAGQTLETVRQEMTDRIASTAAGAAAGETRRRHWPSFRA